MTATPSPPPVWERACSQWRGLSVARRTQALCVATITLLLLLFTAMPPASRATLQLGVTSQVAGELQVYLEHGAGFSEEASSRQAFAAGSSTLSFDLPAGHAGGFRLDPPAGVSELRIDRIGLTGEPEARSIEGVDGTLRPLADVESMQTLPGGGVQFRLPDGATDAQILYVPDHGVATESRPRQLLERAGWLLIGLCAVVILAVWLSQRHAHVLLAGISLGLVLVMACFALTSRSVSPDERLHEADARYFAERWSPPRLDSEAMLPSLKASPYGVSYLNEWNITYLLAGKFSNLTDRLGIDDRIGFRLYQAGILAGLLALVLLLGLPRSAAIPVLLTPQLWYLFAYMNGDALPLAASLLAAALVFAPSSRLRAFLCRTDPLDLRTLVQVAVFVGCFALLIVSKRNYWPVATFLAVGAAIVPLQMTPRAVAAAALLLLLAIIGAAGGSALTATYGNGILILAGVIALACAGTLVHWGVSGGLASTARRNILRYSGVFVLAAGLASPWIIADYRINEGPAGKAVQVEAMREAHAAAEFRPSQATPVGGIRMRDQGYSPAQLLAPPLSWQVSSFKSFFGVYGYMQYYAADALYWVFGIGVGLLLLIAVGSTLLVDPHGKSYLVLAACSALALIAASFLHSWTYDFQAQGRYLIGCLAFVMPFIFCLQATRRIYTAANILVAMLFLAGVYSFVWIGLPPLVG